MRVDIGEQLVGAYLKTIENCDVVSYNVRPRGGGLQGLGELDVVGLRFLDRTAILCEVITHIKGTLYGTNEGTVRKILQKHERQKTYADTHLVEFTTRRFMLWAPRVPRGYITNALLEHRELELVINENYKAKIDELRREARNRTNDEGNDAFRLLQILESLRG